LQRNFGMHWDWYPFFFVLWPKKIEIRRGRYPLGLVSVLLCSMTVCDRVIDRIRVQLILWYIILNDGHIGVSMTAHVTSVGGNYKNNSYNNIDFSIKSSEINVIVTIIIVTTPNRRSQNEKNGYQPQRIQVSSLQNWQGKSRYPFSTYVSFVLWLQDHLFANC